MFRKMSSGCPYEALRVHPSGPPEPGVAGPGTPIAPRLIFGPHNTRYHWATAFPIARPFCQKRPRRRETDTLSAPGRGLGCRVALFHSTASAIVLFSSMTAPTPYERRDEVVGRQENCSPGPAAGRADPPEVRRGFRGPQGRPPGSLDSSCQGLRSGSGFPGRSLSQAMESTHHRFPSWKSWRLLIPRRNGFSLGARLSS